MDPTSASVTCMSALDIDCRRAETNSLGKLFGLEVAIMLGLLSSFLNYLKEMS
nr:hypothetical protein Q903MT_gene3353 [Picea sitchensis]